MEEDVEADDESKPSPKRCVKCNDFRLWGRVKGILKVEVLFMVACNKQAFRAASEKTL